MDQGSKSKEESTSFHKDFITRAVFLALLAAVFKGFDTLKRQDMASYQTALQSNLDDCFGHSLKEKKYFVLSCCVLSFKHAVQRLNA